MCVSHSSDEWRWTDLFSVINLNWIDLFVHSSRHICSENNMYSLYHWWLYNHVYINYNLYLWRLFFFFRLSHKQVAAVNMRECDLMKSNCHKLNPSWTTNMNICSSAGRGWKLCSEDGSRVSLQKRSAHLPHQQLRHDAQRPHGERRLHFCTELWLSGSSSCWFLFELYLIRVWCWFFPRSSRRGQQTTAKRWKVSSSCSWRGRR